MDNLSEIKVKIISDGQTKEIVAGSGDRLSGLLRDAGIFSSQPCGGEGRCGGCRVRFLEGAPKPSEADVRLLSVSEIADGVRLLCRAIVSSDCIVETTSEERIETAENAQAIKDAGKYSSYAIAIDLGSTTIAGSLVAWDKEHGKAVTVSGTSVTNHQRAYGSDVISRISAACEGHAKELQRTVLDDISHLIEKIAVPGIKAIVIAGNTTMLHLLRGYDVSGLGKYPYTPVTLGLETLDSGRDAPEAACSPFPSGAKVVLFPGISAFVGADIVSGIYGLGLFDNAKDLSPAALNAAGHNEAPSGTFFIDLGTNGEMAYINGDRIDVTSAAAGPVFEAGGISCGCAAIPGAICSVSITADKQTSYQVISGTEKAAAPGAPASPIGICGTGVMEAVSELVRCGIVDETGLLSDEYFDGGYPIAEKDGESPITLTQQDIRSFQLAKAAIYSASKTLLSGRTPERTYIAGGFGNAVNLEKFHNLGMFPDCLHDKIIPAGNTSLLGAVKYAGAILEGKEAEDAAAKCVCKVAASAHITELSQDDAFSEEFLSAMNFREGSDPI